jgi:hypothetical protein
VTIHAKKQLLRIAASYPSETIFALLSTSKGFPPIRYFSVIPSKYFHYEETLLALPVFRQECAHAKLKGASGLRMVSTDDEVRTVLVSHAGDPAGLRVRDDPTDW